MLGDNILLLGIIISIVFFVLGIRSFKNEEDWFEGTFYFLISAMSTCLMSVMLLSGGDPYITTKGCGAIALIGPIIGFLAAIRMASSIGTEVSMVHVVSCAICLLFFEVYLIVTRGILSVFEDVFENGGVIKVLDVSENSIHILILIYFISMAIGAIYSGLSEKKKQVISMKVRSVLGLKKKEKNNNDKKDYIKFIDFKEELKKRRQ